MAEDHRVARRRALRENVSAALTEEGSGEAAMRSTAETLKTSDDVEACATRLFRALRVLRGF